MILWDTKVVQLIGVEESNYTLSYRFKNCVDDFSWIFIGINDPTSSPTLMGHGPLGPNFIRANVWSTQSYRRWTMGLFEPKWVKIVKTLKK